MPTAKKQANNLKNVNVQALTTSDLQAIRDITDTELKHRKIIEKVIAEFEVILDKHKLSFDIVANAYRQMERSTYNLSSRAHTKRKNKLNTSCSDLRKTVKPKFFEAGTANSWSGRGRTPNWVAKLCTENKITIEEFKASNKYKVKEQGK